MSTLFTSTPIVAKARKLSISWSVELEQTLQAFHGFRVSKKMMQSIAAEERRRVKEAARRVKEAARLVEAYTNTISNFEKDLVTALSNEIQKEIDREIAKEIAKEITRREIQKITDKGSQEGGVNLDV